MEINVTSIVNYNGHSGPCVGSQFELGPDAARITWNNAKRVASEGILKNDEEREEARDYFKSFGAWDRAEIAGWTNEELDALVIQDVLNNLGENFEETEDGNYVPKNGDWASNLYMVDNTNEWYFYLGI